MRFSTPLVILALCVLVPLPAPGQQADTPDLSGVWLIDPSMSQTAREQMREDLKRRMDSRGADPRRTSRMNDRWKSVLEQDKERLPQAGFGRLEISHQPDIVQIAYRSGRNRDLFTDGRPLEPEAELGIESGTANWEGARLVVETQTQRGEIIEFWELSDDGARLFMTTEHTPNERLIDGLKYQRVYKRELAGEGDSEGDPEGGSEAELETSEDEDSDSESSDEGS